MPSVNVEGGNVVDYTATTSDLTVELGFVPRSVTLLNKTTGDSKVFQVLAASGEVEPLAAQTPADAVDYSVEDGGVIGDAISGGVTIKASLALFNDQNGAIVEVSALR